MPERQLHRATCRRFRLWRSSAPRTRGPRVARPPGLLRNLGRHHLTHDDEPVLDVHEQELAISGECHIKSNIAWLEGCNLQGADLPCHPCRAASKMHGSVQPGLADSQGSALQKYMCRVTALKDHADLKHPFFTCTISFSINVCGRHTSASFIWDVLRHIRRSAALYSFTFCPNEIAYHSPSGDTAMSCILPGFQRVYLHPGVLWSISDMHCRFRWMSELFVIPHC